MKRARGHREAGAGILILAVGLGLSAALDAAAQTAHSLGTVQNGSGTMSTNTVLLGGIAYRHASAAGQPGGIATHTNVPWTHYAGFLQTVDIKRPALDTDRDGILDELDLDNDNDGLADLQEISGSGFNPGTATEVNRADTDGDGVPDGQEAVAGTDPQDPNALFRIIALQQPKTNPTIYWLARQGKTYTIQKSSGSYRKPETTIWTNTGGIGSGPWFVVTNAFTNMGGSSPTGGYYTVRTIP